MILITVVALGTGVEMMRRRSLAYQKRAAVCDMNLEGADMLLKATLSEMDNRRALEGKLSAEERKTLATDSTQYWAWLEARLRRDQDRISYFARLSQKYRYTASHPWLPAPADSSWWPE